MRLQYQSGVLHSFGDPSLYGIVLYKHGEQESIQVVVLSGHADAIKLLRCPVTHV